MKLVLKSKIPGWKSLSKDRQRAFEEAAAKSVSKAPAYLIVIGGLFLAMMSGFITKKLRESTGTDELSWVGPIAASLVIIVALFFYYTKVLNPRIIQLIKEEQKEGEEGSD